MCKRVLKETEGKGVDVVFDAVGGEIFPSALDWYVIVQWRILDNILGGVQFI